MAETVARGALDRRNRLGHVDSAAAQAAAFLNPIRMEEADSAEVHNYLIEKGTCCTGQILFHEESNFYNLLFFVEVFRCSICSEAICFSSALAI